MQSKLYIGTNTKMNKTIQQTVAYLEELGIYTEGIGREKLELFVIPSFITLDAASKIAEKAQITLGAQNMSWEDRGEFTGEISPLMLQESGVQVVCIGHSERRHVLLETDEMENKKVLSALGHGFTPFLCIGETKEQKEWNIQDETLRKQIKIGLHGTTKEDAKHIWIAYEPVWAIGVGGTPANADYVEEKHKLIRNTLVELYEDLGNQIPILYGGSVNNENAKELIRLENIDGLFIGRSAWEAKNFSKIIHETLEIVEQENLLQNENC